MVYNRKYCTIMKLTKQGIIMSGNAERAYINIANSSLDISILTVYIGEFILQVYSGTLPNTAGNATILRVPLRVPTPNYYDIAIIYSTGVDGQSITFTDSTSTFYCQNANLGSNLIMTFFGVYVDSEVPSIISVQNGACF